MSHCHLQASEVLEVPFYVLCLRILEIIDEGLNHACVGITQLQPGDDLRQLRHESAVLDDSVI